MVVDLYDAMACACFSHFVARARATSTASSRVLLSRTNGWSNMQPATSPLPPPRPCACRHMAGSHSSCLPGAGLFITRCCPKHDGCVLGRRSRKTRRSHRACAERSAATTPASHRRWQCEAAQPRSRAAYSMQLRAAARRTSRRRVTLSALLSKASLVAVRRPLGIAPSPARPSWVRSLP